MIDIVLCVSRFDPAFLRDVQIAADKYLQEKGYNRFKMKEVSIKSHYLFIYMKWLHIFIVTW